MVRQLERKLLVSANLSDWLFDGPGNRFVVDGCCIGTIATKNPGPGRTWKAINVEGSAPKFSSKPGETRSC